MCISRWGLLSAGGHIIYVIMLVLKKICFFNLTLLPLILLGKADDKTGCLKSVMAIYLFRKMVADLKQDDLDFSESLLFQRLMLPPGKNFIKGRITTISSRELLAA